MKRYLCIYHANCADGFTAAWVVRRALGIANVEFYPGVYGETPPDVAGRDVILVDFSYKRDVLVEMARRANTIVILDHHKTARDDLDGLPPPVGYGANGIQDVTAGYDADAMLTWARVCNGPALHALFDMARSGAGLAWDFFFPGAPRPNLVAYVEDRDLWKFELKGSREVSQYIFSNPYQFPAWDFIADAMRNEDGIRHAIALGAAIETKHFKDIHELLAKARRRMVIAGVDVPVANLPPTMTSDAGHIMALGEPFAACYMDTALGRVFSLRSADNGFDVSAIAARYGGGGHARAAGFTMPIGWEGDR